MEVREPRSAAGPRETGQRWTLIGIECIRQLRPLLPTTQFIALTVLSAPEQVFKALGAGATGYLAKRQPPAKIIQAIQDVHQGGSPMSSSIARLIVQSFQERGQARRDQETLSTREREILALVAKGARNKEVSEQLDIALDTVQTHLRRIYKKLHVHSRTAAAMAVRGN
jgi:DNA-binding NarL/FixJ family response regulator